MKSNFVNYMCQFLKEIIFQFQLSSHIKNKRYSETTECSFAHGLSSTYNLAKQIVITLKSLRSFSVLQ